ncbi:protein tyrosine phosphatase family protein [Aliiglaciecola aliphaticivorans]
MKIIASVILLMGCFMFSAFASESSLDIPLPELKNYQVNNEKMVSSGLPSKEHLQRLQTLGLSNVVDLIPDDRTQHQALMDNINLNYHNIAVEWENPTLENFQEYVRVMQEFTASDGVTLTHCRVNMRGSVFTYLYQVTQLHKPEKAARQDMLAIWQPNDIWLGFIDEVLTAYKHQN